MKSVVALLVVLTFAAVAFARLGETEQELIKRFGEPDNRGQHSVYAQGKNWVLGPTLRFHQDDWQISCDLVDGRVVRINYKKRGEWTEDQIQFVLGSNSQGVKWTENKKGLPKLNRSWKRTDGAVAEWSSMLGMSFVVERQG